MAAMFFLAFSVNGLTLLGASVWVSNLFNGAALISAASVSIISGRHRRSAAPAGTTSGQGPQG